MLNTNTVVFAVFNDREKVNQCVDKLKSEGFQSNEISVLMPDKDSTKEFSQKKKTKAPEGTTIGASTGTTLGGVLGWLTGIGT